jgi:hypothetical protein
MTPTEDPPSKVSTLLLLYDNVKDNPHPITLTLAYSKDNPRLVNYTVKVPITSEELKQELRASLKSGRKYDYESDRITVSFADDSERVGV